MILTFEQFLQEQKAGMPPVVDPSISLAGQVVIVTGANVGLGYEASKHFATRGPAKLIMVARSKTRGQDAVNKLISETGFQNVELWTADLGSFESVTALKDKIDALDRLDILVENAGVVLSEYELSKDGYEQTLSVNLIATALHIILHLPKLLDTARKYPEHVPRIVYVSSDVHYWGVIPAEAISAPNTLKFMSEKENFDGSARYNQSKVLATQFMLSLQEPLKNITVVSLNPGFCQSELGRYGKGPEKERIEKLRAEIGFTSEEGSRQLVYAALARRDRESELRGGYVSFDKVQEPSDFVLSEEGKSLQKKIWKEVLNIVANADETAAKDTIARYLS